MEKILIKNLQEIYTMNSEQPKIKKGHIIIQGNKIKEISSEKLNYKESEFDEIIEGQDLIAFPGFVNCHTHAAMNLMRGIADDLPLQTWLEEEIWPVEARLTKEDVYWGSLFAVMEMIASGTTTFCDMYFDMEQVARAAKKSGIRAVLGQGLIEEVDGTSGLNEALDFALKWRKEGGERINTVLAPHAPYTCSPTYLYDIMKLAKKHDLQLNIHLSETEEEIRNSKKEYQKTPVRHLLEIGFFDLPVIAAHCVHLDEEEIEILAQNDVKVVHNARSNMKLGSGIAPIAEMLEEGITVGLGTDGAASNNNLDLIEEARTASYLQKVNQYDPSLLNLEQLAVMLTRNGARVLNLDKLGALKENFLADIVLINCKKEINCYPHHDNLSNIFYAGNGNIVDTVLINGKIVMKNREFTLINKNKVLQEIEKRAKRLKD